MFASNPIIYYFERKCVMTWHINFKFYDMNFINRHVVFVSFLIDSDDIEDVDAETHPIHFQVSSFAGLI